MDRSFYRFATIHACDRRRDGRTDGQIEFSSLDRVCIPCIAVKTNTVPNPTNPNPNPAIDKAGKRKGTE